MNCETEVLQFGRRYGWMCLCGTTSGERYDSWQDAEAAAGAHDDAWRDAVLRGSS